MGIYSRDYVREPTSRNSGFGGDSSACKAIIIITCIVYVLQLVLVHTVEPTMLGRMLRPHLPTSYVNDWFSLSLDDLRTFQVWRLVSYAFLHDRGSLWHILFNMLGLWWFGSEVERLYGSKEFTWFYLTAAVVSGLGYVLWQLIASPLGAHSIPVVGASGAVLAALTLYAMHYPHHKIGLFYGLFPVEMRWAVLIFAAIDLLPVISSLQGVPAMSGVAHAAHLLGMLFGWLYFRNRWHLSSWMDGSFFRKLSQSWRRARVKQNLKVYAPDTARNPPVDLESELDRILAKIHEQGSDSLTAREQEILTQASQQYKNRR